MFPDWLHTYSGIKRLSRLEECAGTENDIHLAHALMHGRIESVDSRAGIIAYAETWRLPIKEAEILKAGGRINVLDYTLNYGPVLWIAQVTVHPSYAGEQFELVKLMKRKVFDREKDAKYLGWFRIKKQKGFIVPFRRKEVVYG